MSNNILTISKITNEALMVLENDLVFARYVDRNYDDQFANAGAKIGNTVNARKPARFIGTSGPNLNVEDFYESSVPVTLGNPNGTNPNGDQFHVDTQFTTQDLELSMDAFSDRFIKPAVAAIANRIDVVGLTMAKNATANIVGTPGTPPTALLTYLNAQAYLDSEGAPRDGKRHCIIDQWTSASIVDSLKGLFMPQSAISEQYRRGLMGRDSGGMDWSMDQNIVSHTFGAWTSTAGTFTTNTSNYTAGSVSTVLTSGWASTSTITVTPSQAITLNQGDIIQIAGIQAVNPQNRKPYGANKLRNFVVQSTVSGSSGFSVTVSPAIIVAGQFQNSYVASTSSTAAVTPFNVATGTANAVTSPQNLVYHRNAFTLATADLPLPGGVVMAGRANDKENGLSIRIVKQYTINNDSIPARCDVLFGWAQLYPELSCRVAG